MKPKSNKNVILLAVTCVALLGAGLSMYLQLAPGTQDAPPAVVAEPGPTAEPDDEGTLEEELDFEEREPVRRTGGFAFPPGYDGPLEGTEANPPEPEE